MAFDFIDALAAGTLSWLDDARCSDLDPALAFPPVGELPAPVMLEACAACPVREECLVYALERSFTSGIFGGMTAADRRREGERRGIRVLHS